MANASKRSVFLLGLLLVIAFDATASHDQQQADDAPPLSQSDSQALVGIRMAWYGALSSIWSGVPSCAWYGVSCAQQAGASRVVGLNLTRSGLSGPLPAVLANLTALASLGLAGNDLSGSLPPSLGQLGQLTTVDLSDNAISGALLDALPPAVGSVAARNNRFSALLLSSRAAPPSLTLLDAANNLLSGSLASVVHLSAPWPQLVTLDLSGNLLADDLDWLSPDSFPALEHLDIAGNSFEDTFEPARLPRSLRYCSVAANSLSGSISTTYSHMPPGLNLLNISWNNFDGPLPASINATYNLVVFDARHNIFIGPIPPGFTVPSLHYLDLSDNGLTGTIPNQLNTGNLHTLLLDLNTLSGRIPDWVCDVDVFIARANNWQCPNPECCWSPDYPVHLCGRCLGDNSGPFFSLINLKLGLGAFLVTALVLLPVSFIAWRYFRQRRRRREVVSASFDDADDHLIETQED